MSIAVYQLDPHFLDFPPASYALEHPNGLLAIGGDLSTDRLLTAYQNGIFPWYNPGEPILWWSPNPRAILELDEHHVSRSLKKSIRRQQYHCTINQHFAEVVEACAAQRAETEGTWITEQMKNAYQALHNLGHAHSIEIHSEHVLVGGLYGVSLGRVFCGESMFHRQTDASKAALAALVNLLKANDYQFIDCQIQNDHLESLGAVEVTRAAFLKRLEHALADNSTPACQQMMKTCWQSRSIAILSHE